MDDRTIMLVLRFVHILAGLFWVGAVVLLAGFLLPAVRASGPEGGRFMQQLMQRGRLPIYLNAAAALTLLSGLTMYGRVVAATDGAWAASRPGITFGLGGAAAILAAVAGGAISGPAARRMTRLGEQIQRAGGPPSAEQAAELTRLQARLARTGQVVAALLVTATAAMAVARYV